VSALSGCETTTLAHESLDCLDQANYILDDTVLESMSEIEYNMVELQVLSYQERHKSLCKLIKLHNELFND